MNLEIPRRAFFSFAWTCPHRKDPPVLDGDLNDWGAQVPDSGPYGTGWTGGVCRHIRCLERTRSLFRSRREKGGGREGGRTTSVTGRWLAGLGGYPQRPERAPGEPLLSPLLFSARCGKPEGERRSGGNPQSPRALKALRPFRAEGGQRCIRNRIQHGGPFAGGGVDRVRAGRKPPARIHLFAPGPETGTTVLDRRQAASGIVRSEPVG